MKAVINTCFGGFGLSEQAYEKLIEWGIPVRAYKEQTRDPRTGLYREEPENEGEVIFDRDLAPAGDDLQRLGRCLGRYWESWTRDSRTHPLIVRVVEELGRAADGPCAELTVVEIPDGIEYTIEEYDGNEHIAEAHRTWR